MKRGGKKKREDECRDTLYTCMVAGK